MTKRVEIICAHLIAARIFADIGCDHGYMTEYMLRHALCDRAYISDISAKSLEKAAQLLSYYVAAGACIPVVADGLDGIPEPCDLVLIAGMGGEEIVGILERHPLPAHFVLQPMKNVDKVRKLLLSRGAKITVDYTFEDGKFYDLVCGDAEGGDTYTEKEMLFGRDNLRQPSQAFLGKLQHDANNYLLALSRNISERKRAEVTKKLEEIEEIIHATQGNL